MAGKKDGEPWRSASSGRGKGRRRVRSGDGGTSDEHSRALSNPVRVGILGLLGDRIASTSEVAELLDIPLCNAAYHISILRKCDLVLEDHRSVQGGGRVELFYKASTAVQVGHRGNP